MTDRASGPLQGARIVITRPARQSAGLAQQIAALGGKPMMFPAIVILPPADRSALERAQRDLEQYDYAGATALAALMLVISFALLLGVNLLQRWSARHFAR